MTSVELLIEVIKEHTPKNIWQGSPLFGYRKLGNTNRGEIGEEFIRRYLQNCWNRSDKRRAYSKNRYADCKPAIRG